MIRSPMSMLPSRSAALAIFGFILSLVGALGGAFYLEPAQTRVDETSQAIALERSRSRMLLAANSDDDLAEHLGGLLFSISLPRDASDEQHAAIGDLMMRGLDHRHDGVRAYLAALGAAGAIDFPSESSRYEILVAAERANFNIDTYRAANAFEGELAMRMGKAQGDAAMKSIMLGRDWFAAKGVASQRALDLLTVTMLGSALVFLAAMAAAGPKAPAPSPVGAPRLFALALARLKARNAA
jgi:hypothetical protein